MLFDTSLISLGHTSSPVGTGRETDLYTTIVKIRRHPCGTTTSQRNVDKEKGLKVYSKPRFPKT